MKKKLVRNILVFSSAKKFPNYPINVNEQTKITIIELNKRGL